MRSRDQIIQDTEPFPDSVIKRLPPRNESYVPWYQYAQRLLLHHGAHRYEISHVVYGGDKWTVAVRLYLDPDEWYDGVGTDQSADAAESQAYKRACAHAGIGLHLYEGERTGKFWLHERLKKTANDSGPE